MMSKQDLFNLEMCLQLLKKYFLSFMNLHSLVFFICIKSILILLEQRIPENNFVVVLWEKNAVFYHSLWIFIM